MTLSARSGMLTDVGRRRQVNEDWCGSLEPADAREREQRGWVWLIADGVGAYGTGEEASHTAGAAILETYRSSPEADPIRRLRGASEAGNRAVWERRRHYVRLGQSRPVMTTALGAVLLGDRAILAHVGDCRGYLIRAGRIRQVTQDHTWVGEQLARGLLTPEEARNHPRAHVITRSLGQHETIQVDIYEEPLQPGDRLVLCSDGLTRYLEDDEILQMATRGQPRAISRAMLDLANARGGEDNITVAVVEVEADQTPLPQPPPRPVEPRRSVEDSWSLRATPLPPVRQADPPARQADPPPRPPVRPRDEAPPVPRPAAAPLRAPVDPAEGGHLAVFYQIGQRISSSLDLDETLQSVVESVVDVTGGERGFIMLWDEQSGQLTYSIGHNLAPSGRQVPEFSRNIVKSVFESGKAVRIGDALADARYNQFESVVIQNLRSVLCAPLEVKGKRIGIVYVENRLGAEVFSQADLELLQAFAGQAAIAIENARLHEALKKQVDENAVMRTNQANVLRSISSAIISLDAEDRVLLCNRPAEELLGIRAEYALKRQLQELLPASLHRTLNALLVDDQSDASNAVPEEVQLEVRLPHRGRVVLAVKMLPLADSANRRVGSVLVVDDMTKERLLSEARQREETEKERVKAVFGRYLAPSVVEQLMGDPESIHLGGTRREVTVLFADIRGFTGISERHSPEEVVSILNSYLACATEVILRHGGTLDKFLGDGVMAFFNAPLPQENHVLAATRAALEMQTRLQQLQGPTGSRIAFGVGINTGEGIVGNIGTSELMNYTVIGDVVNVAARLQGEARAGEVLLSGNSYERIAAEIEVEELGSMHVKGRTQPVPIFKVLRVFG